MFRVFVFGVLDHTEKTFVFFSLSFLIGGSSLVSAGDFAYFPADVHDLSSPSPCFNGLFH
ncbi:hypothetical protein LINGRAHAP2_LOCUS20579 [Linum grandiflorum]